MNVLVQLKANINERNPKASGISSTKGILCVVLIFDFDCSLQGETPLSHAAALGQLQIVTLLVKAKAGINDRNNKARAPCNPIFSVFASVLLNRRDDIDCDAYGEPPICGDYVA